MYLSRVAVTFESQFPNVMDIFQKLHATFKGACHFQELCDFFFTFNADMAS